MRMHLAEKTRGNEQRRVLVLDQIGHDLHDGVFDFIGKLDHCRPVYRFVGIPLGRKCLRINMRGLVGPDGFFCGECKVEFGRTGFDRRTARSQAPCGFREISNSAGCIHIGHARLLGIVPATRMGVAARDPRRAVVFKFQLMTLGATPAYFNTLTTPTPETVDVNLPQLFGSVAPATEASGVYLMVREGKVVLEQGGQTLAVDAGEAAYAGRSLAPLRLASTPVLLDRDLSLSNRVFNFNICRP